MRMQEKTGRVISSTTLKRIWGRVAYQSTPSRHSLDTLAQFLDFDSWRSFCQSTEPVVSPTSGIIEKTTNPSDAPPINGPRSVVALSMFMLALGAGVVLWLGSRNTSNQDLVINNPESIIFRSRPVALGLPNTVVFDYDLSTVQADSYFIQQSWDERRRVRIDPQNENHSAVYLYPGYFDAKLVANNTILKEHPVHVKTEGWTPIVEKEHPVYLPEEAILDNGAFTVSSAWLVAKGFDISREYYEMGYYNVRDFGPIDVDNFTLEASILHSERFDAPCQGAQILVRARYGIIRFPFDRPGCVGAMHVTAGDVFLEGKNNDLSSLGADFNNWQSVRLEVKARKVKIQIGTNAPYELSYSKPLGGLVGMWFEFVGIGAIDSIRLRNAQDQLVYEENF